MMFPLLSLALVVMLLALYAFLGRRLKKLEAGQHEDRERLERLETQLAQASNERASRPSETLAAYRQPEKNDLPSHPPAVSSPGIAPIADGTVADDTANDDATIDYAAIQRDLEHLPHGELGLQLLDLHRRAPELAAEFSDVQARQHFLEDFGPSLMARLHRLVEAVESGRLAAWLHSDWLDTLNQLARHLSVAADEAHGEGAFPSSLTQQLEGLLYRGFGDLCPSHAGYHLDRVVPYETRFDPSRHHALGGRDSERAAGLVVALKVVGRRPIDDQEPNRAQVVVGR